MRPFDNLVLIECGKSEESELDSEVKGAILSKISKFRYFILRKGPKTKEENSTSVTILWALFGTNSVDDLVSLLNEESVLFYKVNILNAVTSVIEMSNEQICNEKIYYSSAHDKDQLLAQLLLWYIKTTKSVP